MTILERIRKLRDALPSAVVEFVSGLLFTAGALVLVVPLALLLHVDSPPLFVALFVLSLAENGSFVYEVFFDANGVGKDDLLERQTGLVLPILIWLLVLAR